MEHGGKLDMEKLALIDFSLEDDSLFLSTSPENENPQLLDTGSLPLSRAVATGKSRLHATGQQSSNSGNAKKSARGSPVSTPGVDVFNGVQSDAVLSVMDINAGRSNSYIRPSEFHKSVPSALKNSSVSGTPSGTPTRLHNVSWSDSKSVREEKQEGKVSHYASVEHGKHLDVPLHDTGEDLTELQSRGVSILSAKKMGSTRTLSRLRKSLAWDKAFSTDEGVLDIDELPLVVKTPKKLPELHPLDIPKILAKASPLSGLTKPAPNSETARHVGRITSSPGQGAINSDCGQTDVLNSSTSDMLPFKATSAIISSDLGTETKESNTSGPIIIPNKFEPALHKVDSARPVAVDQIIKSEVQKGTRLRLPSTFTRKTDKSTVSPKPVKNDMLLRCKSTSSLLSPSSASSSLSKKVSSVSKKVKDTLGKVLPAQILGSFTGSAINRKANGDRQGSDLNTASSDNQSTSLGKVSNTLVSSPLSRSKSSARGFLSGSPMKVPTNIRKIGGRADMSNHAANTSHSSAKGMIAPNSKVSSRLKDDSLWGSIRGKTGPSSRNGSEKPTSSSIKVSPVYCKNMPGAEADPPASQVPIIEKLTSGNASESTVYSSGLRLPSPKIGFFDTARPSVAHQVSHIPEKVHVAASNPRNGLPPRPQQGFSHGRPGQPLKGSTLDAVATRLATSGIPSAPHLRPPGKHEKGLVPSVSAPASPHRHDSDRLLSPASYRAVTDRYLPSKASSDESQRGVLKAENHPLRNNSETFRKLRLVSNEDDFRQLLTVVEESKVDPEPQPEKILTDLVCASPEGKGKLGSLSRDLVSSKPLDLAACLSSFKSSMEPPSSTFQFPGCMGRTAGDVVDSTVVEDSSHLLSPTSEGCGSGGIDSDLCRDGNNMANPSSVSTCTELNVERKDNGSPLPDNLDSSRCVDFARVTDAVLGCTDFDKATGSSTDDRVAHKVQIAQGPHGNHPEQSTFGFEGDKEDHDHGKGSSTQMSMCVFGWQEMHSRLSSPESFVPEVINQSSKPLPYSQSDGSSDNLLPCRKETLDIENSRKAMSFGEQELEGISSQNVGVDEDNSESCTKCATEEQTEGWSKASVTNPVEKQNMKIRIQHPLDSPPHWSGWPVLVAGTASVVKETGLPIAPVVVGPVVTADAAESFSSPPISDQSSKSPLAVNRGVLNGIDQRTPTSLPLKKERNYFLAFARSAVNRLTLSSPSENIPAQENSRVSEGQAGSTIHRKSKPSKTSQKLAQIQTAALSPFSEERLCALEAAGQESLLKKSGAVQHSPPNKISPNRNPWSPVKRNGQQLGPFDCTKKHTSASMTQ